MELPPALRRAVDLALQDVRTDDLARAADALSARYRAEVCDGRLHMADSLAARAYAAARLPATYAAIRDSFEALGALRASFAPETALDVGAGPGSAIWAAAERWPSLRAAVLVEAGEAVRALGKALAEQGLPVHVEWRGEDLLGGLPNTAPADLVTLAYVLDELPESARGTLVDRLWALTRGALVIVEPGTPAGWRRILAARSRLIAAGAHLIAPCPHAASCPLVAPDWCHFSRRVARSRIHLRAKDAEVPWEDERYSYLAVGRTSGPRPSGRVIAPPRTASGRVWLKLCRDDGLAGERLFSRRDRDAFRLARRAGWGEAIPAPDEAAGTEGAGKLSPLPKSP
ncbi:MAG: small ribosomal subunit Rsm22 family protein [Opitutaceae bacterium]